MPVTEKPIVLHVLSGDIWGGKEAQMRDQLKALRNIGWDVRVLFFNKQEPWKQYEKSQIPCLVVEERSRGFISFCREALQATRELRPQLVVSHGYKETILASLISLSQRCPFISTFHGAVETSTGIARVKMSFYVFLHRWLSKLFAARIIVVAASLAKALYLADSKKLLIVHNVINVEDIISNSSEPEHNDSFSLGRPALVIVGRLVKAKAIHRAIEALACLRTLNDSPLENLPHLYVIGEGPEKESLVNRANQLDIEHYVHFVGFRTDARRLIQASDLLLITSEHEGLPTVLLEALSSCTPVISNNLEGVKEVLQYVPSYPATLLQASDPHHLALAIKNTLQNTDTPDLSAQTQKALQSHFSAHSAALSHASIYHEVLATEE